MVLEAEAAFEYLVGLHSPNAAAQALQSVAVAAEAGDLARAKEPDNGS